MDYQILPVDLVKPSPMNPRKTIDEAAIAELAENIKAQGLIQPITVRPVAFDDRVENGEVITTPKAFEIVCGERRYRAFSKLNESHPDGSFSKIPAIVRTMTDAEAFDAMITENLQRQDVDPIEEAFAFGQLIKNGKTAEEIALRFGKSIRFVQDRIKLNSLIPELMVAVRDDKMSISAAMIISKLDVKDQEQFYKTYTQHYEGFTKNNAERFVSSLFMDLEDAAWNTEDAKEEFTGGCDCKCSECKFNTKNHGCLFYEMNSDDDGNCTNREKFASKTLAYIEQLLKKRYSEFVKKDAPLEKGKTVIANYQPGNYTPTEVKNLYDKIKSLIESMGLEVVDPYKCFNGRCSYDDDRLQQKIEDGEVYHYLTIFDYSGVRIEDHYGYVNKKDLSVNCDANGLPLKVKNIIGTIEQNEKTLDCACIVAGAKAINEYKTKIDSETPLQEFEREMLLAILLKGNYDIRSKFNLLGYNGEDEQIVKFVQTNKKFAYYIIRSFICSQMSNTPTNYLLRDYLEQFGNRWLPDEYNKAIEGVKKKHEKAKARATTELAKLGYDIHGKKLKNDDVPKDIIEQHASMKAKHPDSVILFRVGDFYETYGDDAKILSKILGITLTHRKAPKGTEMTLCGFPHHALDTYLPKLIRGGQRVAICEDK